MSTATLKPFWRYFGGKYRAAPKYPKPKHATIVEPFAGAAGYSMRYPDRNVILVERYDVIAEMWRFLISATQSEILRIPEVEHVDELPTWVPAGGRYLVGFSMNSATTSPRKKLSAGRKKLREMGRSFEGWTPALRERVAQQVVHIRHWKILEGDYTQVGNNEATWFIDPPYQVAGKHYVHSDIDFASLGVWCRTRVGQTIVCEAEGATWLPFETLGSFKASMNRTTNEVVWYNETKSEGLAYVRSQVDLEKNLDAKELAQLVSKGRR